jgi:hypothetical protein
MDIFKSLGITVGEAPSLLNSGPTQVTSQEAAHSSQVVRKGFSGNPRDRLEEQLSKGVTFGMPVTMITQIPIDIVERTKVGEKKKPEYLKDTHAESFHVDLTNERENQVKEFLESEEEIVERSLSQEELFIKGTEKAFKLSVEKARPQLPPKPGSIRKPPKDPEQSREERQQARSLGVKKSARHMSVEDSLDSLISFGDDPYADRPELLANVHENSNGVIERLRPAQLQRSSLDETLDLIKGADKFDYNKDGKKDQHEKDHEAEAKQITKLETKVAKKKSFIKSEGPGGIVFDFGHLTGNRIADEATALLNQFGDPVQMAAAQYQDSSYKKALVDFTTKGEMAYAGETTPFGNINKDNAKMLGKSFDQQVQEDYDNGKLYQDRSQPAVKNDFNKTEITLGGQVIKATSETDAALIKMMMEQQAPQGDGTGQMIDASNGGKVSITAGE